MKVNAKKKALRLRRLQLVVEAQLARKESIEKAKKIIAARIIKKKVRRKRGCGCRGRK